MRFHPEREREKLMRKRERKRETSRKKFISEIIKGVFLLLLDWCVCLCTLSHSIWALFRVCSLYTVLIDEEPVYWRLTRLKWVHVELIAAESMSQQIMRFEKFQVILSENVYNIDRQCVMLPFRYQWEYQLYDLLSNKMLEQRRLKFPTVSNLKWQKTHFRFYSIFFSLMILSISCGF